MEYINKIIQGDCFDVMDKIQDKSIDLILTDPPFAITRNKWDKEINLGELWKHYNRIIKDNGAIIIFAQGVFFAKLVLSNEKQYRYDLVWKKGNRVSGFLNANKMPLRSHEMICVFYNKLPTLPKPKQKK